MTLTTTHQSENDERYLVKIFVKFPGIFHNSEKFVPGASVIVRARTDASESSRSQLFSALAMASKGKLTTTSTSSFVTTGVIRLPLLQEKRNQATSLVDGKGQSKYDNHFERRNIERELPKEKTSF